MAVSRASLLGLSLQAWALGPLVELVLRIAGDGLGANPQEEILRGLGRQMMVLLWFVLSMPHLARWARLPGLRDLPRHRRAMGLWTFAYAGIHLLAYLQFEHDWNWALILKDVGTRPFVAVGLLALLLMLPLALTSNRWSMLRLGQNWKKLHRLVWLISALALAHYFLHKAGKNDFSQPLIFLGVWMGLVWLRLRRP